MYNNCVPRGITVDADCIVDALKKFLKTLQQKWLDMVPVKRVFH